MKLGIILGTWDGSPAQAEEILAVVKEAEACGYFDSTEINEIYEVEPKAYPGEFIVYMTDDFNEILEEDEETYLSLKKIL